MARVTVRLCGNDRRTGAETQLGPAFEEACAIGELDRVLNKHLVEWRGLSSRLNLDDLEVAVDVFSDDGSRPAFHLSRETLALMAELGADFDFDPYTYAADDGDDCERD